MPIQSDDIKLLKSQNMDDTAEGGGAMTGVEIIDGQSNNIFPDTSTDDRAAGRVNFRKVFGVAHTADTDTLLGASFIVLEPPADPLVHCTVFETPGWADDRTRARELVERYLVKGPRLSCRIADTHYAGALLLQLYQVAGGRNFPEAGDAVVVRNPDGQEQYVRVIKVTLSSGSFVASDTPGGVGAFDANLATCELGQPLLFDALGPPISFLGGGNFAELYSTNRSQGTQFYGVKRLASAAAVGERSLQVGDIFSPLVPAATLEEPLIDILPLTARASLSRTASGPATVTGNFALGPGVRLALPTAAEPGSLTMAHGGAAFTANAQGELRQGATVVGTVNHIAREVLMLDSAPNYGTAANTITYRPATVAGAGVNSEALEVTTANQGLGWVYTFDPPPAPATLTVSYMAQGRWYDLVDNGSGKVSGGDSSYGAGTLNYLSGSIAFTLGALPDVGSAIIMQWGNAEAAVQAAPTDLPARVFTSIELDERPNPGSLSVSWTQGGTGYTANIAASGSVTGAAATATSVLELPSGKFAFDFSPDVLPVGPLAVSFDTGGAAAVGLSVTVPLPPGSTPNTVVTVTNNGSGLYTLPGAPIAAGTVRATLALDNTGEPTLPASVELIQSGTELFARLSPFDHASLWRLVGSVDSGTGVVQITANNLRFEVYDPVPYITYNGFSATRYSVRTVTLALPINAAAAWNFISLGTPGGGGGAPPTPPPVVPKSVSRTAAWRMRIGAGDGLGYQQRGVAFNLSGQLYASAEGTLTTLWNARDSVPTNAGSVSSDGSILVTSPPANGVNAVTWINAGQDRASGLNIYQGAYRVQSAPIKTGGFSQQSGARVGQAADTGVITGGAFTGTVDFARGIVRWATAIPVPADTLTYNAVFLQYLPLDGALLGLETARLPLDGRVPIYRPGGQVVVHNTLTTALPNPLVKGTVYSLGRQRIAAVVVRTLDGQKVPGALYTVDFSAGTIVFPVPSDITTFTQPFTVHHRIEDELMVLRADISGKLDLVAALTHAYPAGTSFVSSKLRKGDRFARAYRYIEQSTWGNVWSDELLGDSPTASFNSINYPVVVTNRGAITERWAVIFTGATQVRVVGENVGQVLTAVSINAPIEPINPQTGAPYFSIDPLGWGGGWSAGNVLRFNTDAAGGPAWIARTILQGPPTVASDKFTLAFRADVDTP